MKRLGFGGNTTASATHSEALGETWGFCKARRSFGSNRRALARQGVALGSKERALARPGGAVGGEGRLLLEKVRLSGQQVDFGNAQWGFRDTRGIL